MPTINVTVRDKGAYARGGQYIVCSNRDYVVAFDFDAEWDDYEVKTARFIYGGKPTDIVFSGNTCAVPVIHEPGAVEIGVYAGDLNTTTAACIVAKRSILSDSGVPEDPAEDVYNQIMDELNRIDENIADSVAAALVEAEASGEFDGPKGEKGDPFTYEDFTAEQLEALTGPKGDPFTFEDFTEEQLESLRGPAGELPYLDWYPLYQIKTQLAAEKTVTNSLPITDTTGGFRDLTTAEIYDGMPLLVVWDGVEYPVNVLLVSATDGDYWYAGNMSIWNSENENTGEPFLLMFLQNATLTYYKDGVPHVASVYAMADNPIPDEFLSAHNADPEAHPILMEQMRAEMLQMLSDLGLVSVASSDGSVVYTSNDGKIYVL